MKAVQPAKVRLATDREIWPRRREFHVLTYAEEGFAPLNLHADGSYLGKDALCAFADAVNQRDEPGSLHPAAAISAIPRDVVRDRRDSCAVQEHVTAFLKENRTTINARRLLFDFRTPDLAAFVLAGLNKALEVADLSEVDEVVIVTATR